jgi:hypothetical protein
MKLETFENTVQIELRFLRRAIWVVGTSIFVVFILVLLSKQRLFLQDQLVQEKPLASWVCKEAFTSIANHRPYKELISDEILTSLSKSDFKVEVEEILVAQEIDKGKCRLIVKSGERIRSFLIDLAGSKANDFYYKLSEIHEIELNKDELDLLQKDSK